MRMLYYKIRFILIGDGVKRAKFLKKKKILNEIGNNCMFQSRNFPMDPKCLKIHNNVTVAAHVHFVTHDAIRHVLNYKYNKNFKMNLGCIEIMDNVFIGLGSIIMPNVRIGENCIVAAGSVVTKDVPSNTVVAGVPAKRICSFDDLVKKRIEVTPNQLAMTYLDIVKENWDIFYKSRGETYDKEKKQLKN